LRPVVAKRGDRYGLLLLLLVVTYLLAAFTTGDFITIFESVLFVATLLLALRTSHVRTRTARLIIGGTLIGSVIVIGLVLIHAASEDTAVGIANIWIGLVLLVTVGVIVRRILSMPLVSLQSIFGAISAYMIIGLMFASFYAAMSHFETQPFFANGQQGNTRTFQYFSFTTLTTLGYGDFTAAQNAGRAVAVMEAFAGQIFLATLVARLVASYRSPRGNGGAPADGSVAGNAAAVPGGRSADGGTGQPGVGPGAEGGDRDGRGDTGGQNGPPGARDGGAVGGRDGGAATGGQEGEAPGSGQAVSRRGPGIPRHAGGRNRPARRASVKWHGRRRR
jgi:hypothetical protein